MLNRYYTKLKDKIEKVIELCESPIEEKLLLKITEYVLVNSIEDHSQIIQNYQLCIGSDFVDKNGEWWDLERPIEEFNDKYFIRIFNSGYNNRSKVYDRYIDIKPQHKIFYFEDNNSINKKYYILDFGVFLYETKTDKLVRNFCIECDGYEFHSKKEHIIKDNTRSRKLLVKENDYTTLRYLGREINEINDDGILELLNVLFQEKQNDPMSVIRKKRNTK
jgi:hypothetical protein